jgi:hypothetical protein
MKKSTFFGFFYKQNAKATQTFRVAQITFFIPLPSSSPARRRKTHADGERNFYLFSSFYRPKAVSSFIFALRAEMPKRQNA